MTELLLAYTLADFWQQFRDPREAGWLVFGFCGNLAFASRFLVQWIYSERAGESKIPDIFWWQSIVGTLILLVYFVHRKDPVGMLGYAVNVVPYVRNLVLVHRKKRAAVRGFPVEPPAAH